MNYYVNIHGTIIPDGYVYDLEYAKMAGYCTPAMIEAQTVGAKAGDTIFVSIASEGGSVNAGHLIVRNLKATGAYLVGDAKAFVASEAVYIFASCDKRIMANNAMLLIHNAECEEEGTQYELASMAKALKDYDDMQISLLATISGKSIKYITDNYFHGRSDEYLTAQEALSEGFINEIYNQPVAAVTTQSNSGTGAVSDIIVNAFQALDNFDDRKKYISNRTKNYTNITNNRQMAKTTQVETPPTIESGNLSNSDFIGAVKAYDSQILNLTNEVTALKAELEAERILTANKGEEVRNATTPLNTKILVLESKEKEYLGNIKGLEEMLNRESIYNSVIMAVAAIPKNNDVAHNSKQLKEIVDAFIVQHKITKNENGISITNLINEPIKGSLDEIVSNYCKRYHQNLFKIQTGNGHTPSNSFTASTTSTENTPDFIDAVEKANAKYYANTREWCQLIININPRFADNLDQKMLAQFKLLK